MKLHPYDLSKTELDELYALDAPSQLDATPKPISKVDFDALNDVQKGYVSYEQAAHNPCIPDRPPEGVDLECWQKGRQLAILAAQDAEG